MIKKEFTNIFHSKSIMLLLVAIVLIPFVYSFCFLTSAWDPYGNTGKVPIAVVNNDQPTHLQGKLVNVGAQTVAKLRKDNQLGWHIVSAKKAAEGLKDNKYYTVVTIPRNFSKNAATVLDPKPKQMKMTYETNGSLNYISEVMSQVGADTLNSQIRASVTNAFASTLIAQIGNIGKQIGKAATGATQISDGTVTLDNGVNQYTIGVSQVHDGIQTMKVAAKPLSSGVQQLDDGSHQIKNGLGEINGEINGTGDSDLVSGVSQLTDGSSQIENGLGTLNGKVPALSSGVQQLHDGSSQLYSAVAIDGKNADGSTKYSLSTAVKKLTDGTNQLYAGVVTGNSKTPSLVNATKLLVKGLAGFQNLVISQKQMPSKVSKLNDTVNDSVKKLKTGYGMIAGASNATMVSDITNMMGIIGIPTDKISWTDKEKAINFISKETDATDKLSATINALPDKNTDGSENSTKTELKTELADLLKQQKYVDNIAKNSTALVDVVNWQMTNTGTDSAGDPTGLQSAVNEMNTELSTRYTDPTGQTAEGLNFTEAIQALVDGAKQLEDAVNVGTDMPMSMSAAVKEINSGMNQLNSAVNKGANGTPSLVSATSQLSDGLGELQGNVPALSDGVKKLYEGSTKETDGLTKLNGKAPKLSSGITQLLDGSGQLSDGLDQLNGKVPTLLDGINQLADGTTQLTDNSGALTDGTKQLKDGSKQLATGLVAGSKQVNGVHLTKATAKMFAEPSKDVQKRLTTVPNYGAALAPYVLALALFIAIIIFNFTYPMRRHDGYKTVADWFKAKIAVGTLVALAMALVEATLMMIVGLPVDHVFQFYGMTILFALSAMYMTQMLNLAFGGVGIFVALGLLTMSGSGGLFPAETISPLYEAFQKFLPMTYAINGFRNAITSGIASGTVAMSVFILIAIGVISIALMFPAIKYLLTKLPAEEK